MCAWKRQEIGKFDFSRDPENLAQHNSTYNDRVANKPLDGPPVAAPPETPAEVPKEVAASPETAAEVPKKVAAPPVAAAEVPKEAAAPPVAAAEMSKEDVDSPDSVAQLRKGITS